MMQSNNSHNSSDSLDGLAYREVRAVIEARLKGRCGPIADPQGEPRQWRWLYEQYLAADRQLRDHFTLAMKECLEDLGNRRRWSRIARMELLDLIQACGSGLVEEIRATVRKKKLLKSLGKTSGREAHAGLLKCLISLNVLCTPRFWVDQGALLGKDYGALIFSGLMKHDLDVASEYLPELCENRTAVHHIRQMIPSMISHFGLHEVRSAFARQFPRMSEEARTLFSGEIQRHADPLDVVSDRPRLRLAAAFGNMLPEELMNEMPESVDNVRDLARGS